MMNTFETNYFFLIFFMEEFIKSFNLNLISNRDNFVELANSIHSTYSVKQKNDGTYSKELIQSTENFDIYRITWGKNAKTRIHDHAENGCILYLVSGLITEIRYNNDLTEIERKQIKPNETSYITNKDSYHSILGDEFSISYHLYSPSGHSTKYF